VTILRHKIGVLMLGPAAGQFGRIALAATACAAVSLLALRAFQDAGVVVRIAVGGVVPLGLYVLSVLVLKVDSARWLVRETVAMVTRKGGES
jgi:hypothetical protein